MYCPNVMVTYMHKQSIICIILPCIYYNMNIIAYIIILLTDSADILRQWHDVPVFVVGKATATAGTYTYKDKK